MASQAYLSLVKGMRTGFPLVFSAMFFGLIFGFTGASGGFPLAFVSAMSYIIFAGSAQFITLLLFIDHEQLVAIIIAATLLNLRHLLYGAVLNKLFTFRGIKRFVLAYLLTDEAFLVTTLVNKEQLQIEEQKYRLEFVFIGAGLSLWITWNLATIFGFLLYQTSSTLIQLPENFVISASFVGFLLEQWVKYPHDRLLIAFSTLVAFILGFYLTSSILLITVMILGSSFAMVRKRRELTLEVDNVVHAI